MRYASLHHHSTYSYGDGYGTPEQHVDRAVELEMSALALTEHGNVSSHVRLEKAAIKAGVKPIFGCELYTGGVGDKHTKYKWHLTVLAEDQTGYANLMRLVSRGWEEGFYFEPTVSGEMLAEHSEGLIVLSGCTGSKMSTDLLGGKGRPEHRAELAEAERTARRFKALLGDRFYLEAQSFPELDKTKAINTEWERLSRRTGIPIVATGDVHYPRPDDSTMQAILHAAHRGNNTMEKQLQSWGYDVPLTDPLTDAEMVRRMRATGLSRAVALSSVEMAAEIAERCNVVLPKADRLRFPLSDGQTTKELIWSKLREGWRYRHFGALPKAEQKACWERLSYEMGVIEEKDFFDYFLMLSDLVSAAKDRGIPVGPARGSAAASLTVYLLRITEVNPMHFPTMFFERFIDLNRMDIPDVDLDFDDERRPEMWDLARERYGADHVGTIGTYTKYRGKNSVVDVGRVYRVPKYEIDTVNSLIIERSGGDSRFDASLEDTINMFPQAAEVFERHPDLRHAIDLEGNVRGMGVHAAGMVISNDPITDTCALYTREIGKPKRPVSVLSVDKYDAEYLNLMKADFLGLTTMGMIRIALELSGLTLEDLYAIPMDEPDTLAAFKRNDVVGIFQFEGRATRLVCKEVKPDNFMELSDINALSRPGPLFSGTTNEYIQIKHGLAEPDHMHPAVDKITAFTNYQIIYQEQILQIVREVGGFPWTHASAIRKIISQKKGEAAFNEMYGMFVEGAARLHGIDEDLALKIWRKLVTSGTYAFNVAHSVSYSMLGFWCMWLKVHYPVEFYAAQLRKTDKEKWPRLLKDAGRHGIKVLPPDLQKSGVTWGIDKDSQAIIAGFSQVHGIGGSFAWRIVDYRDKHGFTEWADLIKVTGIGPKTLAKILETTNSADPFGLTRVKDELDKVRRSIARGELPLRYPTHNSDQLLLETSSDKRIIYIGKVRTRNYQDFIENQRARTGEEVADIVKRMKAPDLVTSCVLFCFDDGDEDVYLRINRFGFPKYKEVLESIDLDNDVVYAIGKRKQDAFGISMYVEHIAVIDPNDDDEEDEVEV